MRILIIIIITLSVALQVSAVRAGETGFVVIGQDKERPIGVYRVTGPDGRKAIVYTTGGPLKKDCDKEAELRKQALENLPTIVVDTRVDD